ncbi:MAG: sigma-70 family RNA polymerase sigma factor [Bacteroidetes bacterium]|nr:sigma-70 family RNA polymerase sigma factor [Bacteroidota bacterium]
MEDLTYLLNRAEQDADARQAVWDAVYEELRGVAHGALRRYGSGETIQTVDLVNETYLKLFDQSKSDWNDRVHFFAVAARAMRYILIDYARGRNRQKRGGGVVHVSFDDAILISSERSHVFLALDEALTRLDALNGRWAQIIELRFFGGMTEAEIAALFDVSERTVRRDWRKAKAWLSDALRESGSEEAEAST